MLETLPNGIAVKIADIKRITPTPARHLKANGVIVMEGKDSVTIKTEGSEDIYIEFDSFEAASEYSKKLTERVNNFFSNNPHLMK